MLRTETTQQSTTAMAEGRMRLNPQRRGKMTTVAAMTTTDSQVSDKTNRQAGSKDLMPALEKEAIKLNQACQVEASRQIIDL
jgi:hypothetical protein